MKILIFALCFILNTRVFGQENGNYNRIVGGKRTNIQKQPYQIALYSIWNKHNVYCGGSVISSKWILTAGHCCYGNTKLLVKGGSTNICNGEFIGTSKQLINHPDYNKKYTYDSDICLVELENELILGENNVDKIELAESDEDIIPGETVRVTGWGTTSSGGRLSCNLLGINVRIFEKSDCEESYGQIESHFCAGLKTGGKDSCQGDSGGPLVSLKGKRKQLGIVSFGRGCADSKYPGAYTSVPLMREWIRSVSGI